MFNNSVLYSNCSSVVVLNNDAVDALQESFDSLLSGESIEDLYEWQTGFGFIGSVE